MPNHEQSEAAERAIEAGEQQAQEFADQADPLGWISREEADRYQRDVLGGAA